MEAKLKLSLVRASAAAIIGGMVVQQSVVAEAQDICGNVFCAKHPVGHFVYCEYGGDLPYPARCEDAPPDLQSPIGYCTLNSVLSCD